MCVAMEITEAYGNRFIKPEKDRDRRDTQFGCYIIFWDLTGNHCHLVNSTSG